jgi:predicted DNA-binding protein (MmcQ/YjbR family)
MKMRYILMTRDELQNYCLSLTGTGEDFPFGPQAAVYKVMNKMFAILPVDETPQTISLKCDPIEVPLLREKYEAVRGGYHLNKTHWNTVTINSDLPDELVLEMVEDSYLLVRQKLTKKVKAELEKMEG